MKRIALVALFGALAAGCNQQAVSDLAVCKSDLGKAQAEVQASRTVQAAADAKVAELEQARQELAGQLEQFELAASEGAAKTDAAKAKAAAYKKSVQKAAEKADVKNVTTTPPKQMTQEQKNKSLGF